MRLLGVGVARRAVPGPRLICTSHRPVFAAAVFTTAPQPLSPDFSVSHVCPAACVQDTSPGAQYAQRMADVRYSAAAEPLSVTWAGAFGDNETDVVKYELMLSADSAEVKSWDGAGLATTETFYDVTPAHNVTYCATVAATNGHELKSTAVACVTADLLPPVLPVFVPSRPGEPSAAAVEVSANDTMSATFRAEDLSGISTIQYGCAPPASKLWPVAVWGRLRRLYEGVCAGPHGGPRWGAGRGYCRLGLVAYCCCGLVLFIALLQVSSPLP